MKQYYVIQFNDLSEDKQADIKNNIYEYLVENNHPVDTDLVEDMVSKAWCELEISIGKDETSHDKWRTDAYLNV